MMTRWLVLALVLSFPLLAHADRMMLLGVGAPSAPGGGGGDVTFVAAVTGTDNGNGSVTTGAINPGSGSNRAIFVMIPFYHSATTGTVASVTFNSGSPVSGAQACARYANTDAPDRLVTVWRILAPPSESATVTVSFTGGINAFTAVTAIALENVNQTTPYSDCTNAQGENAAPTVNVPNGASGDLTLDVFHSGSAAGVPSVGASQTQRGNLIDADTVCRGYSSTEPSAAGTTGMTWTITSNRWTGIGLNVKKA